MKISQILSNYSLLDKISFKCGDTYLPSSLKRKIISAKIEYGKVNKEFESNTIEFKQNYGIDQDKLKTDEEYRKQTITEINKYINELLDTDKDCKEISFTQEEYDSIVDVTADDVELNGLTVSAQQYLEILYDVFCNKE